MKSLWLTILVFLLLLSGCATEVELVIKPQAALTLKSSITVLPWEGDIYGTKEKIEHLLLAKGFNLISSKVALEKEIKAKSLPGENNPAKEKSRTERYKGRELKSEYSLHFKHTKTFLKFFGSVIRVSDGEIVVSADYRPSKFKHSKTPELILEEFVTKLASAITP